MSNNKQQTAVERLIQNIPDLSSYIPFGVSMELHAKFQQAKEMEKQQMDKVAEEYFNEGASYMYNGKRKYESFENYYNETYGGNK